MPAYPFLSLFIADLFFGWVEQKKRFWRVVENFFGGALLLAVLLLTLFTLGWNPPLGFLPEKSASAAAFYVDIMQNLFAEASLSDILVSLVFLTTLILWYFQRKGPERLIPGAPFLTLLFSFLLFMNAFLQPQIGKHLSVKPFAEKIKQQELPGNNYYSYGRSCFVMSFYLNRIFLEFPGTEPESGILILGEKELEKLRAETGEKYQFTVIDKSSHPYTDIRQTQCRVSFQKLEHR